MANWYGATRTNYFKVKDEQRYQALFNRLKGDEDTVEDFTRITDGETWHAFGCYSDIFFMPETINDDDEPVDFQEFLKSIADILTDDSCFVITCIGNEKLRYLTGVCQMAFPDGTIVYESLDWFALRKAKEHFGKDYTLYLDY